MLPLESSVAVSCVLCGYTSLAAPFCTGFKIVSDSDVERLLGFLEEHPRILVLTGAGASVDSGIPTYRDESGRWLRADPIQHQDFLDFEATRQRYWARSLVGWRAVSAAQPSDTHHALAELERQGRIELLITQNVDGLHQRAGSQRVVDLHGNLVTVSCVSCSRRLQRMDLQHVLEKLNPHLGKTSANLLPDGDADVIMEQVKAVNVPSCESCEGILKPDVVFYGGTVAKEVVNDCMEALQRSDALMVVGSSLQVYSGYRFCRRAAEQGLPICIVNVGATRADDLATLKLNTEGGPLLKQAVAALASA